MNWPDEIAAGLPSPRGDEPAGLRRDIADELADHLACATDREMVRAADADAARRAALRSFGDPTRLARQLWMDAMKEAIMKDRILLGTVVLLALAVIGLAATTWTVMRHNQETNRAMLTAIQGIADRTAKPVLPSDLATLTVRAFKDKEGGPPLEGMRLSLRGAAFEESKDESITLTTDGEGKAEFGPIRPGSYTLEAYPQDVPSIEMRRGVMLYAGRETETSVVPPAVSQANVRLLVDWPEDLLGDDLRLAVEVGALGGGWRFHEPWFVSDPGETAKAAQVSRRNVDVGRGVVRGMVIRELGTSTDPTALPTCDVRSSAIWLGQLDGQMSERDRAGASLVSVSQLELPDTPETRFTVQPSGPNEWHIAVPESVWKAARADKKLRAAKALLGWTDPGILSAFDGQLVGVVPVERSSSVPAEHDARRPYVTLSDADGGTRPLLHWQSIPAELAQPSDRRFLLALFSRATTSGQPPGAPLTLQTHEITESWPEKPSWESPAISPEPSSLSPFEIGKGWKTFDVTNLVRAAERENRQSHGVLLRFQRETNVVDLSSYTFYRQDRATGDARRYRPVLLVVEPTSKER